MMGRVLNDLRAVARRFLSHDGFLLAAGLSYSFLLCLAPLALLFFFGVGYLLQSDEIAGYVLETVRSLFPGYGSEVLQALGALPRERRVTGVVGGVGLAIFATQLFSMTRTVVNVAFRVEKRRGMFHGFLFDVFALAVAGLLAAAVSAGILALVALGSPALRSAEPAPLLGIRWARVVALPVMYAAMLGLLFFVYRTFPKTGVATRAAAVGALAVAVLWEIARWVFSAYVGDFGVYGTLYGSFGVIVASLVWIYFSAAIFVLGAELTALLTERQRGAAVESIAEPAAVEERPLRLRHRGRSPSPPRRSSAPPPRCSPSRTARRSRSASWAGPRTTCRSPASCCWPWPREPSSSACRFRSADGGSAPGSGGSRRIGRRRGRARAHDRGPLAVPAQIGVRSPPHWVESAHDVSSRDAPGRSPLRHARPVGARNTGRLRVRVDRFG